MIARKHGSLRAKGPRLLAGFTACAAVAALLAAIFTFTGCGGDGGGGGGPTIVTYAGTADGETYTLEITDDTSYVLTVGTKRSTGTAAKSGGTYTLTPAGQTESFTVTVSGNGITAMHGTITFDDGETRTAPETVTPAPPPGGSDNPFKGTWTGQTTIPSGGHDDDGTVAATVTVVVSDATFESTTAGVNGATVKQKGTYTYNGTTMTGTVTAVEYLYNGASEGWSTDPEVIERYGGAAFSGTLSSNGKLTVRGVELTKTTTTPPPGGSGSIVGQWRASSDGTVIEFKSNGELQTSGGDGNIFNTPYTYSETTSTLTLTLYAVEPGGAPSGPPQLFTGTAVVSGNSLTISGFPEEVSFFNTTYTRVN